MANKLRRSMHRRYLRAYHCFVLISLCPLLFSVWHYVKAHYTRIMNTQKKGLKFVYNNSAFKA